MLKALIFDADGTLAMTEMDYHRVAYNHAFAAYGLDWHWDEGLYLKLLAVAGGKERMSHYVTHYHALLPEKCPSGHDFIDALYEHKTAEYTRLLNEKAVSGRPGVFDLIQEANVQGLRLAIASTSHPDNVIALLRSAFGHKAHNLFEVISCGDVVPHKKPAPDIYQYVLRQLDLSGHECLAIEDSALGMRSAIAAGIPALVTANELTLHDDFSGALLVVDHLGTSEQPLTCLSAPPWPSLTRITLDALKKLHASSLNPQKN